MHHLVVMACHHAAASASPATSLLSMDEQNSSSHATEHWLPSARSQDIPDDAPWDLMGVAATCLAIVFMLMLLFPPRMTWRLRRALLAGRRPSRGRVTPSLVETPDLYRLSVSRT
ncbi:MAG: hypothetical protein ACR2KE_04075 [Candidatus Nanopelagicales bacterium]